MLVIPQGMFALGTQYGNQMKKVKPVFEMINKNFETHFGKEQSAHEIKNSIKAMLIVCTVVENNIPMRITYVKELMQTVIEHYREIEEKNKKEGKGKEIEFEHFEHFIKVCSILANLQFDFQTISRELAELLQSQEDKIEEWVKRQEKIEIAYYQMVTVAYSSISRLYLLI